MSQVEPLLVVLRVAAFQVCGQTGDTGISFLPSWYPTKMVSASCSEHCPGFLTDLGNTAFLNLEGTLSFKARPVSPGDRTLLFPHPPPDMLFNVCGTEGHIPWNEHCRSI